MNAYRGLHRYSLHMVQALSVRCRIHLRLRTVSLISLHILTTKFVKGVFTKHSNYQVSLHNSSVEGFPRGYFVIISTGCIVRRVRAGSIQRRARYHAMMFLSRDPSARDKAPGVIWASILQMIILNADVLERLEK